MLIANPIYDVVFKRMMENEKVAKFFIGTLLEQTIETIEIKPQEYTYHGELDLKNPKDLKTLENRIIERHSIWVYRLDFIATIKTETGELKKVLIEIQKAKNQIDLMRFRNYLGEQYKKEDFVISSTGSETTKVILPITTIYILGFIIPEIKTPCLKVERNYKDLVNKSILKTKSDFVEKLTHSLSRHFGNSFIVQVERITDRYQTRLDKLLSVFEQKNFVESNKITKEYMHKTDLEEVKIITDILHHSGTNPKERKEIEDEQEAWRTVNAMFEDKEKELLKEINENKKIIIENRKIIDENKKIINEKDKALEGMAMQLNDLKRKLGEK